MVELAAGEPPVMFPVMLPRRVVGELEAELPEDLGLVVGGGVDQDPLRLQAAQMFEHGIKPVQEACQLRVSTQSAYKWWR
jgi:hypothetical protein